MQNLSAENQKFWSRLPVLAYHCMLLAIMAILATSSGCRNCGRCQPSPVPFQPAQGFPGFNRGAPGFNQGFGNPAFGNQGFNPANQGFNPVSQSTTIAPPATYSLNIPGGGATNPLASRPTTRVGQLPGGLISTRQPAPTPATGATGANSPANFNQQQGWRRTDGGSLNTQAFNSPSANGPAFGGNNGGLRPTAGNQASFNSTGNTGGSGNRGNEFPNSVSSGGSTSPSNSAPNRPGRPVFTNVATTRSTDYQTTVVDERLDATRLPVTDASNMQTRVAQNLTQPTGQPYYVRPQNGFAAQTPQFISPQAFPQGSATRDALVGTFVQPPNSAYQGRFANPVGQVGRQFAPPVSSAQLVQAESTATYDPYTSTASDWRNRGRDSRSY